MKNFKNTNLPTLISDVEDDSVPGTKSLSLSESSTQSEESDSKSIIKLNHITITEQSKTTKICVPYTTFADS